jgi:hypothetical protein
MLERKAEKLKREKQGRKPYPYPVEREALQAG